MSLKTNFWIDLAVFIGFLVALEPHLTGNSIHEWLTLSGAAVLVVHLLIHWDWLVKAILRFFKDDRNIVRLNLLLAFLVFIGFTTILTSGLVISRVVVPFFGLPPANDRGWSEIHSLAANLTLFIVTLHFALHWDWVARTFTRVILDPLRRRIRPLPAPAEKGQESRRA
ncbi:MAG: DUF4405 domain-containing protein [Bacteroidota bacterium]